MNQRTLALLGAIFVFFALVTGMKGRAADSSPLRPIGQGDCVSRYDGLLARAKDALIANDRQEALSLLLSAKNLAQSCAGIGGNRTPARIIDARRGGDSVAGEPCQLCPSWQV